MALNFPGPYEVRLTYRSDLLEHTAKYNCIVTNAPIVGENPNNVTLQRRNLSLTTFQAAMDAWLILIRPLFALGTEFFDAQLWKYAPNSFSATFITSAVVGGNGTNILAYNPATQQIMTFRTQEGGICRLNFMEASQAGSQVESPPYGNVTFQAVSAFVISVNNWILARDTSYPVVPLRLLYGQNEATFKQRYRPQ